MHCCRALDMEMLSLFNSHERDADAWASLFKQADERFIVVGVTVPSGAESGIVEARWLME